MIPTVLQHPEPHSRVGAGTIVVTVPLVHSRRWRVVLENDDASTGSITAVSWRKSAVLDHYGPPASQTVSAPVAPGSSWGASDDGDCIDRLEVTITVDGDATINVSAAGAA